MAPAAVFFILLDPYSFVRLNRTNTQFPPLYSKYHIEELKANGVNGHFLNQGLFYPA